MDKLLCFMLPEKIELTLFQSDLYIQIFRFIKLGIDVAHLDTLSC